MRITESKLRSIIRSVIKESQSNDEENILDRVKTVQKESGSVIKRGTIELIKNSNIRSYTIVWNIGKNYGKYPICQLNSELEYIENKNIAESILSVANKISKETKQRELGSGDDTRNVLLQILNFSSKVQNSFGGNVKEYSKEDLEYIKKYSDESKNGWHIKK